MIKSLSSVRTAGVSHTESIVVFNQKDSKMLLCDMVCWQSLDNSTIIVGLIIPCPKCGYPIITKPDQITLDLKNDKKINFNQKISCPARWKSLDNGVVDIDENGQPITVRCGWSCNGIKENTLREE